MCEPGSAHGSTHRPWTTHLYLGFIARKSESHTDLWGLGCCWVNWALECCVDCLLGSVLTELQVFGHKRKHSGWSTHFAHRSPGFHPQNCMSPKVPPGWRSTTTSANLPPGSGKVTALLFEQKQLPRLVHPLLLCPPRHTQPGWTFVRCHGGKDTLGPCGLPGVFTPLPLISGLPAAPRTEPLPKPSLQSPGRPQSLKVSR